MKYQGSCHCGQIAFEVEGELDQVIQCNCSICARKGSLLWPVPASRFRLLTPPEQIATYTFGRHVIQHRFCPKCGIHPFAQGLVMSRTELVVVNVRCLEDVDAASLPVKPFDGRSL